MPSFDFTYEVVSEKEIPSNHEIMKASNYTPANNYLLVQNKILCGKTKDGTKPEIKQTRC